MRAAHIWAILLMVLAEPGLAGNLAKIKAEVQKIHQDAIVVDGHNDLPWALRKADDMALTKFDLRKNQPDFHTDIPRLRKGRVGAQFWSAYVPADTMFEKTAIRMTLEQIDLIHRMIRQYPEAFEQAKTAADIRRIAKAGRIASLIGVEGGHSIDGSMGVLRTFYDLGVRYMTLTHSLTLDWVDSATDDAKHNGLTDYGRKILAEMNRLGMFVDISHVSEEVMLEVLKHSRAPVIASHSSAKAIADHVRNISDPVLKQIKKNGGVVMVNFYSGFVEPKAAAAMKDMFRVARELRAKYPDEAEFQKAYGAWKEKANVPRGNVATVVDHIDHIVKVAGIDHVGLGADYDGVTILPEGLEDVSTYPLVTEEMLKRGYKAADIKKVLGENLLRAMAKMEQAAQPARS